MKGVWRNSGVVRPDMGVLCLVFYSNYPVYYDDGHGTGDTVETDIVALAKYDIDSGCWKSGMVDMGGFGVIIEDVEPDYWMLIPDLPEVAT